ncbi:FKBP-type peptidylprolyl isomerase [Oceanococcus atlanticus]|uniref:Peptidyl-prolyl cis-trans isomerase n=1 Tax=Oceanococcus atlanticus TaxID=1317117 RepID=A0A1Y1SH14_9GAMM|nr:peptidylprolyl isomerase [Oceanococcus atlanticus]ORE88591.1 FKBP-type peptidylprolyl isomerase [Oceanococcus atlanticus]RZO84147.1 MAG: peptidylprolyl isomerase [Oceanococcus sp.]
MQIADNTVVSFDYTLRNDAGETVDTSSGREPMAYLHGHNQIVAGLEKEMTGRSSGDSFQVTVSPDEGYGPHRPELVQVVPREAFQGIDTLEVGMRFQADSAQGPMLVRIAAVEDSQVTVDGNHDLAGQNLHFDIAVTDVREATAQELEHGHVHADGQDH